MAFNSIYRLRVDLEAFNGKTVYAQYENFQIDSEATKYNITFAGYQGTAGLWTLCDVLYLTVFWRLYNKTKNVFHEMAYLYL